MLKDTLAASRSKEMSWLPGSSGVTRADAAPLRIAIASEESNRNARAKFVP
jgi:hypothetical protein